jgi:hypothetical protein
MTDSRQFWELHKAGFLLPAPSASSVFKSSASLLEGSIGGMLETKTSKTKGSDATLKNEQHYRGCPPPEKLNLSVENDDRTKNGKSGP